MKDNHARLLNPMWMTGPIGDDDLPKTRLSEWLAIDALSSSSACSIDLMTLHTSVRLARALGALGYGGDELPVINLASAVLKKCEPVKAGARIGLDSDGVGALRNLLELLEGQRAVCGGADYARALLRVSRDMNR